MSNFNEYFRKQGAELIVKRFFRDIDLYSKKKITSMKHSFVDEPPRTASYYIENGLTAVQKVRLEYTLDDDPTILTSEFEVPMEIDGAFIIEGAYRISTNVLGSDYDCRINMSGSGNYYIKIDYNRSYDINTKKFKIAKNNGYGGIPCEKDVTIPYDKIDTVEGETKELLRLNEHQIKKFQIKLDLDYRPEYVTTKLIQECLAFGDDRQKDLIIDKRIESVPVGFMNYMFRSSNGKNYNMARKKIANYLLKNGKLQDQINPISSMALKYFKGSKNKEDKAKDIQVPPGINAMNLESLGSKITIPESVAFGTSFADLIDIADTPINNNTNLQNSLTVSTRVSDEGVYFKAYTKEFQVIELLYEDYLNSKVCASEYVDYNTMQVKPNDKGEVEVKYRMKRRMVPASEIELIDLHPDFRLSKTTRRIPFVNSTDSVRISMGTSMLKQTIPIPNAQRSLVDTGHSEELKGNILNESFKYDSGKVKSIDEDKVTIELPDGTDVEVLRRTAIKSQNDISVFSEPKVKVGQKVKKGDVICGAVDLTEDTYKAGINALVLFSAHFGLVNEDALVVSESFAKEMCHYSVIDLAIDIKTNTSLKHLPEIGTKVKSGDSVATLFKCSKLDEVNKSLSDKLGGLFGEGSSDLTQYMTEENLKVPNNIDEAYVSDVMVQEHKRIVVPKSVKRPDYTFARQTEKYMATYNKDRKPIYDRFPEYVAADTLDEIDLSDKTYKTVYCVRIRLIKVTNLMVGSKVTNRYGGKGVISKVEKDELMPIMVDGNKQHRVQVIMNPYSTINRKIAGVLLEQSLGNCAHRISDLVEEYKKTATGKKKIMPLMEMYYPGRYSKMTVDEFIKFHEKNPIEEVYYFNVGCYSDYTPEKIQKMMDELGVESQSKILMPQEQVTDLGELKANLSEEEYNLIVDGMRGKFIPIDKPLQCGWMTMQELYHIPSYSSKVTTSFYGVDVDPKRNEPIMGRGKYRVTGQKIGEMELDVLLSRNAKQYIAAARKDTAKEDNQMFLNNLLGLGLTVSDDKGYNQGGSDLKARMTRMKTKFRLKP